MLLNQDLAEEAKSENHPNDVSLDDHYYDEAEYDNDIIVIELPNESDSSVNSDDDEAEVEAQNQPQPVLAVAAAEEPGSPVVND